MASKKNIIDLETMAAQVKRDRQQRMVMVGFLVLVIWLAGLILIIAL